MPVSEAATASDTRLARLAFGSGGRTRPVARTQVPDSISTGYSWARRPLAAPIGARLPESDGRIGHDSEQAALIYQHEAQGADKAITDAIDLHVLGEQTKRGDDGTDVSWSSRLTVGHWS